MSKIYLASGNAGQPKQHTLVHKLWRQLHDDYSASFPTALCDGEVLHCLADADATETCNGYMQSMTHL